NTWYENDSAFMVGKNTEKKFILSPPAEICTRGKAHDNVSCNACHTKWSPQCIGCHNAYEENSENAFDLLEYKDLQGSWEEYIGEYLADTPSLGIRETDSIESVQAFAPGMVLSVDMKSFPGVDEPPIIFKRLFAPSSPHTTSKKGRDCKTCHNNPLALGYGRGKLEYILNGNSGEWKFSPLYASNEFDGLPEDAWTGFMLERTDQAATRTEARPFNVKEQQQILLVGSCLTCHDQDSELMKSSLDDFEKIIGNRSNECILPEYYNSSKSLSN
ncbi:MAG TPA: hypothetical protein VKA10_00615, partial [Prolixibacteraceae bacterium]|nr:hypothetical protein [Prolixibacteraceae bacterium]